MSDRDALSDLGLSEAEQEFLRALLADWQLLADLSFSDLVLWVPVRTDRGSWPQGHRTIGQVRPTTGPTLFAEDLVGQKVGWGERPHLDAALAQEKISRDRDPAMRAGDRWVEEAIPVFHQGRVIAVVGKYSNPVSARTPSRLELVYLQSANDLALMIAGGRFPDVQMDAGPVAPRVGDGLIRLDAQGVISYASPNAASALRRLGITETAEGTTLGTLISAAIDHKSPTDEGWSTSLSGRVARLMSVHSDGAVVQMRTIPLSPSGERIGAVVLVHDVTEINRRDRELVTKTATIREIHHRVKNNLQTVAALLRLQARRVDDDAARAALEEAVRRVGSIAVVHETLSSSGTDESVAFDEVADRVLEMLAQVAVRPGVEVRRVGSFGDLPSPIATPLSLVVNELISNALEHGVASSGNSVLLSVDRRSTTLTVTVTDDGVGLPPGFVVEDAANLGLQIVRTLVVHELDGTIAFIPEAQGTSVRVELSIV